MHMREDAEAGELTHRDLHHGIESIDRDTGEDALVSVAEVDREIKDAERSASESARLAGRCALQVVGRESAPQRLRARLRETVRDVVFDYRRRETGRKRRPRWCFRHQLLLPSHYLVLTKPLRLDIQCQRAASVKIGWKYLDD